MLLPLSDYRHWMLRPSFTELLSMPLLLLLLLIRPAQVAVGMIALVTLLLAIMLLWRKEQSRYIRVLCGLCIQLIVLIPTVLLYPDWHPLYLQVLSLGLFLTMLPIAYVILRRKLSQIHGVSLSASAKRRKQALIAEYKRFVRLILWIGGGILLLGGLSIILFSRRHEGFLWIASIASVTCVTAVFLLQTLYLSWLRRHLGQEEWIGVLDKESRIVERVPITLPYSTAGALPLVYLIAHCQGMIYLEHTPELYGDHESYDTPFISWLVEDSNPEAMAQSLIDTRYYGVHRAIPHRLATLHLSCRGQALVLYLMGVDIEAPGLLLTDSDPVEGKWWDMDMLMHQLGEDYFSYLLQSSIPYIDQALLLQHKI